MTALPLDEIQGIVLRGYGMDALRIFVLRVDNADRARPALARIPIMASTPWQSKPATCINLAITADGLNALGIADSSIASFPAEFRAGAAARADIVGDTGDSAPAKWKGNLADDSVHLIVLLYAQNQDCIESESANLRAILNQAYSEVSVYDAAMLPGNVAHFGYRDGFSQPTVDGGLPNPIPETISPTPSGEFILGYPSQFSELSYAIPEPPQFGMNGSFLALRILSQDCAAFEHLIQTAPATYGIEGELLAAKLVGRWRNGTPLMLSPTTDAPIPAVTNEAFNAFDYSGDPKGLRCPIGAHMRRNNPRDEPIAGGGGLKHRIMPRGLPYGPPYDSTQPNDGIERGLLGIFICVSLKDQFEFLMAQWVNGDTFTPGIAGTKAPILGDNANASGHFTIPVAGQPPIIVSGFSRLVQTRCAAYAFLASISALKYIATLPNILVQ